jgi:hypothetical protein
MVNWMKATVFFADILGFSTLARLPRAIPALEALSDVARLLSKDHALAQYLQRPVWYQRYGLSDSIFMVGREPVAASAAAAEFFFNLAYYNATQNIPVLMRGALTIGEVRRTRPVSGNGQSKPGRRGGCSGGTTGKHRGQGATFDGFEGGRGLSQVVKHQMVAGPNLGGSLRIVVAAATGSSRDEWAHDR